jgi:hypothetical protein
MKKLLYWNLLLLWISNPFMVFCQCLSGNYTIGGSAPSYSSIQAALTDLKIKGVCGPVTMNIRSGIYYETLNIKPISGASLVNTITLKSELNDSSLVTIGWNGMFTNTILIDSADFITLDRVTIQTQGSGQTALLLKNSANNITVTNCVLKALTVNSSGISRLSGKSDFFTLKNSRVQDFSNGVMFSSSAMFPIYDSGTVISNNIFSSNYQTSILLKYQKQISLESNKISTLTSSAGAQYGISIDSSKIDHCRKNEIIFPTNSPHYCLKISGCSGFMGVPIDISNNVMSGSSSYSFKIENSHNISLINNTIENKVMGTAVDFISNSGVVFLNNICKSNGWPVLNMNNTFQFIQSDYNLFYSSYTLGNVKIFKVDTTYYNTLTVFQDSVNTDSHSISQDPYFISPTNFHLTPNISPSDMGVPTSITTDIDGDIRDLNTPDIGADEFIRQGNQYDLRLMNVSTNSLTCFGDTDKVIIRVQNVGLDTIFNFKVNLSVNNFTLSPITITDTLIGAEIKTFIVLPSYIFSYGNHLISAIVSQPNNQTDQDLSNNTINNVGLLPVKLSGTYVIGSTGADFLSLRQAFDTLHKFGICDRINLLMQPGIYTDTLTLKEVPGNFSNRIIVSAANGDSSSVVLQDFIAPNSNFHYIIHIAHSSNITFSKLTFKQQGLNPLSTTSNHLVYIHSYGGPIIPVTVDSLIFSHCSFKGNSMTNNIIRMEFHSKVYSFIVNRNQFEGGQSAVYTGFTEYSGFFKDNICINQIEGFHLNNNSSGNTYNPDSIIFSGNYIINQVDSSVNSPCLYLSTGSSARVFNNTFIRKHGLGMVFGTGMDSKIFNNYIYTQNSSVNFPYGANIIGCNKSYFVNNTIRGNASNALGYALNVEFCDSLMLLNNVIENQTSATTFSLANNTNLVMNNNCYSTPSTLTFTYSGNGYSSLATWQAISTQDLNSYSHIPVFFDTTGYQWVNDAILDGAAQSISWLNTDIDGKVRNGSSPDIGAWENYTSTLVWPGDANNDLQVNSQDLYSIGLHYGDLGMPRDSISNVYIGHHSTPWNACQLNSWVDKKFADCNGDSIINLSDTLAIHLNYNLSHAAKTSNSNKTTSVADIFLTFNKSIYNPGDTVKVQIFMGDIGNIQNNVYGASFKLNYDAELVKPNSAKINFINSWIGNINTSKVTFTKIISEQGFMDASAVRLNQTNVNGFGKIGDLEFVIKDSVYSNSIAVDVINPNKISKDGIITNLNSKHDSVLVNQNGVVTKMIERTGENISIYPNPTRDFVLIKFDTRTTVNCDLELMSLEGKVIIREQIDSSSYLLNLNDISEGLYILKLTNENTVKVIKLIVY